MTEHLMKSMHPDQERAARALAMTAVADPAQTVEIPPVQSSVGEGPAIDFTRRDIPFAELPFAYRLMRFLDDNGAVVGCSEGPFRAGACDVDESRTVQMWTQLHVDTDTPEALGTVIIGRFGRHVTFGGMAVPHGLSCVTVSRARGVWVRHIVDYLVQTDELVQRWDVIVRKT